MPSSRPSSLRPEQVWRSAREALFWLDADLCAAWANPAFESLTGSSADSLAGVACQAHGPLGAGDAVDLAAALSPPPEALAGRCATTSSILPGPDGRRLRRALAFQPFLDAEGKLLGILGRVLGPDDRPEAAGEPSEGHRLRVRLMDARAALLERFGVDSLVGSGPVHRRLMDQIRLAAAVRLPVLFVGEPGTGKRHAARAVHQLGSGDGASLRVLDCEALPPEILARELLAPVDPESPSSPRLAAADGSSIVLADVAALPRDLQADLAAALQVDRDRVRVLAATSGDLEAAVRTEAFREDLYLALSPLTIGLAPLRERRDDVPLLAQSFLERLNRRGDRQRAGFARAAEGVLTGYHWPGNLRELARVVEHAHGRGDAHLVEPGDLPADVRGSLADPYRPPRPAPPRALDEILTDVERRLIENAMVRARRNKSRAAELLGVSRPRLYRRLRELGFPDVDED